MAPGYTVGPFNLERFQWLALGPTPTSTDPEIASANFQWDITENLELTSSPRLPMISISGQSPQNFHQPCSFTPERPGSSHQGSRNGRTYRFRIQSERHLGSQRLVLGAMIETNTENTRHGIRRRYASPLRQISVSLHRREYFSKTHARHPDDRRGLERGFLELSGLSIPQRYGVPFKGYFSNIYESDKDLEVALFGDVTARLTDSWRGSAGLRVSDVKAQFEQSNTGPNGGTSDP